MELERDSIANLVPAYHLLRLVLNCFYCKRLSLYGWKCTRLGREETQKATTVSRSYIKCTFPATVESEHFHAHRIHSQQSYIYHDITFNDVCIRFDMTYYGLKGSNGPKAKPERVAGCRVSAP
eukprot:4177573-Amphidinium_carterae.1